jgi:hypothetical protein
MPNQEEKLKLRQLILLIVFSLVLGACSGATEQVPEVTPTYDDATMATQISQLLTAMPTASPAPDQPQVNTAPVDAPPAEPNPTVTNTVLIVNTPDGTATPLPTAESTFTEEAAQASDTPAETSTPTPSMTPTTTITSPASDPRASLGEPEWNDPLDDGQNWPIGEGTYSSASVENGHLVLTSLTSTGGWRMATTPRLTDFYAEMTVSPVACSGGDYYGFYFRVPEIHSPDQGYLFGVSCSGQYSLRKWDGRVEPNGQSTLLVNWTDSDSIQAGSGQTNRLGVMVVGSRITLYANGALLKELQDESFPEGYLGVFVNSEVTDRFTIHVDEMSYWRNP